MESETKKLSVRFRLRHGMPVGVAEQSNYARILDALGASFRDGKEQHSHSRVMSYLESKGSMEYEQPVPVPAPTGSKAVYTRLLVGDSSKECHMCRRCRACQQMQSTAQCTHRKITCPCPFPRRMVPWGKAECAEDKEACEKLLSRLALQFANPDFQVPPAYRSKLEWYHSKHKWIVAMQKRCDSKLFAIRQRMVEAEGIRDPKRGKYAVGVNVAPMGKGLVLG